MDKKRKSNNPLGRPPAADKKVFIGIYVPQSVIDKKGGNDEIRAIFKKSLKIVSLLGVAFTGFVCLF